MRKAFLTLAPACLLSVALLAGCGNKQAKMDTTTPTATLGTDSAQVQAGGPPITTPTDTTSHR